MKIYRKSILRKKQQQVKSQLVPKENQNNHIATAILTGVDKEISIMAGLDHPSLIKLYEVIHDIENPDEDRLCLVIDYAEHGEIM